MSSKRSSGQLQGNRGDRGDMGSRGGQGRSQGQDQRGPPEPTMSEPPVEDSTEHLADINISRPPASIHSEPHASHVQPQSRRRQGTRISVEGLLHQDTHQQAALPVSRPGEPMALGNLITANPEPVAHLTSTTRNMSIAATPAQAPLGVGPAIGGHGEQHSRRLHPRGLPHGPAQPPPRPAQPTCQRCRQKKIRCDRNKPTCSECAKHQNECDYSAPKQQQEAEEMIDLDEIVPGVRILRPNGPEDHIYRHAPPGVQWPPGVAADMIIGWDRLQGIIVKGSWVVRPENPAKLLPHELGRNDAGHMAIRVDEHEGAGEMGGEMDMRTPATARGPSAHPQGFDVPRHSAPGPSPGGRVRPRGSTESPPADDHHDHVKRQRGPHPS